MICDVTEAVQILRRLAEKLERGDGFSDDDGVELGRASEAGTCRSPGRTPPKDFVGAFNHGYYRSRDRRNGRTPGPAD
ncbi:MAG: hypothetical protein HYV13_00795 [Candidatus Doudnabacteria bacterium]|nr:hypothetical protein [Candidatus Doudnabacteria bacterium]